MRNIFDKRIKWIIAAIIMIFILLIVCLGFAMFNKSYEIRTIKRELLINTLSTIISGYLGIIGVLIGIWGTYRMFILQKHEELNSYKKYIKNELKYTLSETENLMISLQNCYSRNFYKYNDNPNWCINRHGNQASGNLIDDLKTIQLQKYLTFMQIKETGKKEDDVSKKNIKEISDIYLFIKKLNEIFDDEFKLLKSKNSFKLSESLIEKSINMGVSLSCIRNWSHIMSVEHSNIDVLDFIQLRIDIQDIVKELDNELNM